MTLDLPTPEDRHWNVKLDAILEGLDARFGGSDIPGAITQAKTYTDQQVATRETPAGAQAKVNSALSTATSYTDNQVDTRETPAGAQGKADGALSSAKAYTDQQVAVLPSKYVRLDQVAVALDTDGTPYFASGIPFASAHAILTDTDGVPYFVGA